MIAHVHIPFSDVFFAGLTHLCKPIFSLSFGLRPVGSLASRRQFWVMPVWQIGDYRKKALSRRGWGLQNRMSQAMVNARGKEGKSMQPRTDVTAIVERPARKVWCSPELRRLPIAATASSVKPEGNSNDGDGSGKGEVTGETS